MKMKETKTNQIYTELARMAEARSNAPAPDVDAEWETFVKRESLSVPRRRTPWGYVVTAMAGAAAALAVVYFTGNLQSPVTLLDYDGNLQQLTLVSDGKVSNLTGNTYSFVEAVTAQVLEKESLNKEQTSEKEGYAAFTATKEAEDVRLSDATTNLNEMQVLSTPRGMDFKVILPDGSEVWLNAETRIAFPKAFGQSGERRVKVDGEAYFKVVKDNARPFIVSARDMSVRVLGTKFNLRSYGWQPSHVSLVEGSVEVMKPDERVAELTLVPGEDAWLSELGKLEVAKIDTYGITQWVDGYFYFGNATLGDVLCELGRWYNLGVVFRDRQLMDMQIHFSAERNQGVENALENLNALGKFRVRKNGKDLIVTKR